VFENRVLRRIFGPKRDTDLSGVTYLSMVKQSFIYININLIKLML
jgi:hypothetical protein